MERGARLALNPTVENYREIRTTPRDTVGTSWVATGKLLRASMDQVSKDTQIKVRRGK
jgi:hypothetical protein